MAGGARATERERLFHSLAAVLASIAGVVVVIYFLGGVVMAIRFSQAHVPAGRAVSLLPREELLTVGLQAFVLPIGFTGLAVWVAYRVLRARPPVRRENRRQLQPRNALVAIAAVWVVGGVLVTEPTVVGVLTWIVLTLGLIYVVVVAEIWKPEQERPSFPSLKTGVAAVLAVAALLLLQQADEPPRLDPARVVTTKGEQRGFLIGIRSEGVYLGRKDRVVAIPERLVETVYIRKRPRRQKQPLINRLVNSALGLD
ncbi:MAG: hypothetical protein ACJ766_09440 [Thermoleophilaceae bacterium]